MATPFQNHDIVVDDVAPTSPRDYLPWLDVSQDPPVLKINEGTPDAPDFQQVGRDTYLSSGLLFKGIGQWHASVLSPSVGVVENMPAWLLSGTANEAIGATFELPPGTYDLKAWVANTTTNANTARFRLDHTVVADGETVSRTVGSNTDVALPTVIGQVDVVALAQITVAAGDIAVVAVWRIGGTDAGTDDAAFYGLDPVAV